MSTDISTVIQRAIGRSISNNDPGMTGNSSLMIAEVAAYERDIFRVAARESRFFYTEASVTSTDAPSARSIALSAITPPIERIVRVLLPTGVPLKQVDYEDQGAELAPRYYVFRTTLYEVGSEWGASGPVTMTVGYAESPAVLDVAGSLSQTVTLPDEYTDLLDLRLAQYLAVKDTGRDPTEAQALGAEYGARLSDVIDGLDHFGGSVRRRFISPAEQPRGSE